MMVIYTLNFISLGIRYVAKRRKNMSDFKYTTEQIAIVDIAVADGVAAAGANPTKAEYDVVVALANANKAKINDILAKLRLADIIIG